MVSTFNEVDRDFLLTLLSEVGPSGSEDTSMRIWKRRAEKFAKSVYTDTHGNSYAEVGEGPPTLMLAGHIDEIGLLITYVDDRGYAYFTSVGGWDPQVLVGQRVRFIGKDGRILKGVIGRKPIHVLRGEERERAVKMEDLHIDFGMEREEVLERVEVGHYGVLDWDPEFLTETRLVSRGLDDKIGAFAVLEALRLYSQNPHRTKVVAVATVQEEIGLRGARTSAYRINPDVAIAVDVTIATDYPGIPKNKIGDISLGKGPVVAIGPNINPVLREVILEAAKEEGIEIQKEAIPYGTPTDANVIQLTRAGIPTALLSIPCRYLHSPAEMVDLKDVDALVRLINAVARKVSGMKREDFIPW